MIRSLPEALTVEIKKPQTLFCEKIVYNEASTV